MHRPLQFKDFYLKETDAERQREGRIKMLVYGHNFIFFFCYDGDVYGGSEEARLSAAMTGNKADEEFFRHEDVEKIEVIKNRDAERLLNRDAASGEMEGV